MAALVKSSDALKHLADFDTPAIVRALEARRPWRHPFRWLIWPFRYYPLTVFTLFYWLAVGLAAPLVLAAALAAVMADRKFHALTLPDTSIAEMVDYLMRRKPLPEPKDRLRWRMLWSLLDTIDYLSLSKAAIVLFAAALIANYAAVSYYLIHGLTFATGALLIMDFFTPPDIYNILYFYIL